jgi:hypothetical protein
VNVKTLLAVLQLIPAIIAAVRTLEEYGPVGGHGKENLDVILEMVQSTFDASHELRREFSAEGLALLISKTVGKLVTLFNSAGLFPKNKGG